MTIDKKPINLDEAAKTGQLERFADEHPSTGDKDLFYRLLDAMAKPKNSPEDEGTSNEG
jgi:hypothetical protein